MTELKPCPFCGGEAHVYETVNGGTRKLYWIECLKCYAESPKSLDLPQDSIDAWNRRDEDCELRGKLMAAHSKIMCLESQIEKLRQRLDRRKNE